jgi:hypothetical protein
MVDEVVRKSKPKVQCSWALQGQIKNETAREESEEVKSGVLKCAYVGRKRFPGEPSLVEFQTLGRQGGSPADRLVKLLVKAALAQQGIVFSFSFSFLLDWALSYRTLWQGGRSVCFTTGPVEAGFFFSRTQDHPGQKEKYQSSKKNSDSLCTYASIPGSALSLSPSVAGQIGTQVLGREAHAQARSQMFYLINKQLYRQRRKLASCVSGFSKGSSPTAGYQIQFTRCRLREVRLLEHSRPQYRRPCWAVHDKW